MTAEATADDRSAWAFTHCGRLAYVEERLGVSGVRPTARQHVTRALLYAFVTWGVPCMLSLLQQGRLAMPFYFDWEAHVRGLIAVPLLVIAEWPIEARLRIVLRRLGSKPFARQGTSARLHERVRWARRVAGHPIAEGACMAVAFAVGYSWLRDHQLGVATWISTPQGGVERATAAGAWEAAVCVPVYVFLLLRWLWRWCVLGFLFRRISRLRLRLVPNHADRAAGLAFVSDAAVSFAWVLVAMSCVASAKWMDAILYSGVPAKSFTTAIEATAVLGVVFGTFPFLAFAPRLAWTRRRSLLRYGLIVARHGIHVERKWLGKPHVVSEEASSMADLNSVYLSVSAIRVVPVRWLHMFALAAAAVAPMAPVVLEIIPLHQLAETLVAALV